MEALKVIKKTVKFASLALGIYSLHRLGFAVTYSQSEIDDEKDPEKKRAMEDHNTTHGELDFSLRTKDKIDASPTDPLAKGRKKLINDAISAARKKLTEQHQVGHK